MSHHGARFEEFSRFALNLTGGRWYLYSEFPQRVDYNLPAIDKGVDLICLHDGVLKLVQCKYRSDVDKPLTFGHDKLSHLEAMGWRTSQTADKIELIVTTTAKRCSGIDSSIRVYSNMMASYNLWLRYNKAPPVDTGTLRDYQTDIIEKCMQFLRNAKAGLVTMPTGSGKTFTFTHLLKQTKVRRVIVAPTLALVSQIKNILNGADIDTFNMSSDNSTNPEVIADITSDWIVTTYQSLHLLRYLPKRSTLIVLDEAHNVTLEHFGILEALPYGHKDLYFTATPTKILDDIPVIAEYSLEKAIQDNYLVNYNVGLIIDGLYDSTLDPVSIVVSGILHCVEYYGNRKIILYCTTIAMVDTYFALLRNSFPGYVGIITGQDSSLSRDITLSRFREADIGLLINVRILREGIDIPEIDTVVFSVQKHSAVDIMQCIGRALRKCDPKRVATVLVAHSLDSDKIAKALRKISPDISSDRIFTVRSIKTVDITKYNIDIDRVCINWISDDREWDQKYAILEEYISEFSSLPSRKTVYRDTRIGIWCSRQKSNHKSRKLSADRIEKLNTIREWRWSTQNNWDDNFNLLVAYISEFSSLPSKRTVYRDTSIGAWCNTQKSNYKSGKLSADRIEKLNAIREWRWSAQDNWDSNFNLLLAYISEFSSLPSKRTVYRDTSIGAWCNTQKSNYKSGKLSADRIAKLNAIREWRWSAQDNWDDNFNLLVAYISEFGSLPNQRTVYRDTRIGSWCKWQKSDYKANKLSADRIEKLVAIKQWYWDYNDALKSLPFWLGEYRKYKNSNLGAFKQYNGANYNTLNWMQKILLDPTSIPEEQALRIVENTNLLDFASKADIGKNKEFFRIFSYYQGDLFSPAFTERLAEMFSPNPLLSRI